MTQDITRETVQKILSLFDLGLRSGLGSGKPGDMCIEAVICNVLEGRNADDPKCVSPVLRSLKIRLNDSSWSSNHARAQGMKRLGIAQLGSAGFLDESEFIKRVCGLVIRRVVPGAFRVAASVCKNDKHKAAMIAKAEALEQFPSEKHSREARPILLEAKAPADAAYAAADAAAADAAAYAAYAAADAAAAAFKKKSEARDKSLATFCEWVVQILIDMNAPGCQWLDLAKAG